MTEPDPPADLAAQLAELRGELARAQGEIGVLRERLEDSTGQTVMPPPRGQAAARANWPRRSRNAGSSRRPRRGGCVGQ